MELHRTVGPARTTITAVAERAGVDRLTVYRHFPDEKALFAACSSHWRALNPPPDVREWIAIDDPVARLTFALGALYDWYRRTHPMLENVIRDRPFVPALEAPAAQREAYVEATVAALLHGWSIPRARRRMLAAAVAHAIHPTTWLSLTGKGLTDAEAVGPMATFVRSAAQS